MHGDDPSDDEDSARRETAAFLAEQSGVDFGYVVDVVVAADQKTEQKQRTKICLPPFPLHSPTIDYCFTQ